MMIYTKNRNMKTDCFAFTENGCGDCHCIALNEMYCSYGEECSFYKTKEKEAAERKAVAEYLKNR